MRTAQPSRMILIILAGTVMSCGAASLVSRSKEGASLAITTEKKEGIDKTNSYCEIIACVGEIKDECEMRIGIMKNYDATIQKEKDGRYMLKVDKAISIEYLKDWMLQDSLSLGRFGSGDKLLYRTYKGVSIEYYARYHSSLLKVTRKIRLDEDAPGYKFTFRQIFQAAETLSHKNKTKVGQETLFVKRRTFQKLPADTFFISPIQHSDLY